MNLGRSLLGDLAPASYKVPENPVMQALAKRSKGVGLYVPASFNVPENPITNGTRNGLVPQFNAPKTLRLATRNAVLDAHNRLKSSGPLASGRSSGVGSIDITSMSAFLASAEGGTSFGIPNYVLLGGGLLALVMFGGFGKGRRR